MPAFPASARVCAQKTPPRDQFTAFPFKQPYPGTPTPAVAVDYGGTQADFVWDAERGGWARLQDGTPHVVADCTVLAPSNVVLLITPYGTAPSDPNSPIALTTGTGDVTVGNATGASGAITFMALSGVLLDRLRAATPSAQPGPPTAIA